jgi:hypothetical protein
MSKTMQDRCPPETQAVLSVDDVMTVLAPRLDELTNNVAFLEDSCRAYSRSVQQVVFVAQYSGTISYDKIMEILEKNGALGLQRRGHP